MAQAKKVFLVSCVGQKLTRPAPAAELYTSPWFTKARQRIREAGHPWFILSAKYGLLSPDSVIAPYEQTLRKLPASDRRAWALRVMQQFKTDLTSADEVVILAGLSYRENLLECLHQKFDSVCVPMKNMTIGRQLQWLSHAKF